jgi:FtsZ-interacting cell division protein ZipA
MPELRWILLIVGAAFVAALAFWELKRQRRFPAPPSEEPTQHRFREPTLNLPEMRAREPALELPVLEIDDDSLIGLRMDGVRIEEDIQALERQAPAELEIIDEEPERDELPQQAVPPPLEPEQLPEPIVEWPPEEERKLLAVRIIAKPGERLAGRAIRLALMAEGFVVGRFSIFHKPGSDARVIVSAASLTQPGSFDLQTMDTHRFGGIYLFAVLPGPLPDEHRSAELIAAAQAVNERLQGELRDERGELAL